MTAVSVSAAEWYFVPLGRECSGYLEFLGLDPGTKESDVGARRVEVQREIQNAFRRKQKELRDKQEEGRLSEEELDSEIEKLEQEEDDRLCHLTDLKDQYDAIEAGRRGQGTAGSFDITAGWLELLPPLEETPEALWSFLRRPRPLATVDDELLGQLVERWLAGSSDGREGSFDRLVSCRLAEDGSPEARAIDPTAVLALIREGRLLHLLVADSLWSRLAHTCREYWAEKIDAWALDMGELGPELRLAGPAAGGQIRHRYPVLSQPTDLSIDHLEEEEIEEIELAPDRRKGLHELLDLGALAALLGRRGEVLGAPEMLGGRRKLAALFALMEKLVENQKEQAGESP